MYDGLAGRAAAVSGISGIFLGGQATGDDRQMADDGGDSDDSEVRLVAARAPATHGVDCCAISYRLILEGEMISLGLLNGSCGTLWSLFRWTQYARNLIT